MTSTMQNRLRRALTSTRRHARVLVAVALAGVITAACDVHGVSAPGTLTSITVTPNATLVAGTTQQMAAVGYDADGRVIAIAPTWSVIASGGAVNPTTGLFTAGTVPGLFPNTVRATVGGVSANASITVIPGALATIVVTPSPVTLAVTTTQQFTAVGKDASGNIVSFTPTWSVVAGGGNIDGNGIFTAGGVVGTYANTVQASFVGLKGFATVNVTIGPLANITVTPNPDTMIVSAKQQFVATGKDVSGNTVQLAATWSVTAGGGTTDQAGLFTAGPTPGTFPNTIKATSGTLSGTATVVVTAGPLATIVVTPNPATMTLSATQQFFAAGNDVAGNPVVIAPVWDVVAGGGTISAPGLFAAGVVSGTFTNTVRATAGGLSGFATVIVTTGPLASITVTPNPVTLPTNSPQQFVAVGKDAGGNVFVIAPVWSVINSGGTINSSGLFTSGGSAGFFANTVQATSGAVSGTATVTVTAIIPPPPPLSPLKSAAAFGILAGSGITCAVSGTINGASGPSNIGSSPLAVYTGFAPPPAVCSFTGIIPLPAVVATAKGDLTAAYLAAQAQVCNPLPYPGGNNLTGLDLGYFDGSTGAKTLAPGTYCFSSTAGLTGTMKLTGSAAAVWTFQIGSALTTAVASHVILAGGAIPDNVYWAVVSSATLGTNSSFQGNIMALASITLNAGSTLLGRALAQTGAVDMTAGGATITKP